MAKKNNNGVYTKEQQINDLLNQTQETPRKRKLGTLGINTNPEPVSDDIDTNESINPDTTDVVDDTVEEQTIDTSAADDTTTSEPDTDSTQTEESQEDDTTTEPEPEQQPRKRKIYSIPGYMKRQKSRIAANSSIFPESNDNTDNNTSTDDDSNPSPSKPKTMSVNDIINQNNVVQINDNVKDCIIDAITKIAPNYTSSMPRSVTFNDLIFEFRHSDTDSDFMTENLSESDARTAAETIWKTVDSMGNKNTNITKNNVKSIIHDIASACKLTDNQIMKALSFIDYGDVRIASCKTKPQTPSYMRGGSCSSGSSSISACTSISASSNKTSNDTRTTTSSTGANINISYGDIQVTVSSPVATTNTGTVSTPEPSSAPQSNNCSTSTPKYDSAMVHAYNNMTSSDRQAFAKLYDEIDRLTNKR